MAIRTEPHKDMTIFGNRLWALMVNKRYDAPRKLATVLNDEGLVKVRSKAKPYSDPSEIRKNAIGSIEKKVVKHLHSSGTEEVQGEFIAAYCKHFGCSADYLFGSTDIQSGDIEIRRICEKTGLSEAAISRLVGSVESDTRGYLHKCWSMLIEGPLFEGIPFDWAHVYDECKSVLEFRAMAKAITDVLQNIDHGSIGYNLEAIKVKTLQKGEEQHYAAYYGMLYKMATDITTEMDKLAERESDEEKISETAYAHEAKEVRVRVAVANREVVPDCPKNDDEKFHWHKHVIL